MALLPSSRKMPLSIKRNVSSIVNEAGRTISSQFIFFPKKFWAYKDTSQTKTNQQNKKRKATIFWAQKLLRGKKLFILHFLKKIEIVLIISVTILLNYVVSPLPLSNYFHPSISTHKTLWPNCQDKRSPA